MLTRKALKRFISDIKLSVSPIPREEYWNRVVSVFPEVQAKLSQFIYEIGSDPKNAFDKWDAIRARLIQDLKDNQKYKEFIQSDMSAWKVNPIPGVSSKSIFEIEANNLGGCYLSIDLKSANFQAVKEVGVYTDYDWNSLVSKYTDSEHIKNSKYFRSVVYGNLNVSRILTVEKYLTNVVRKFISDEDLLPENYKLLTMMPDELIYQIEYNDIDLDKTCKELKDLIEDRTGVIVKVEQFQLQHYYLQSKGNPDRKIKFFGKTNLETKTEELCGLGAPYYLLGTVLWKGMDVVDEDLRFINQEGYECKLLDEFEIKRGI